MHTISKKRKIIKRGIDRSNFDYDAFSKKLIAIKANNNLTFFNMSLETGVCMTTLTQLISGKYKSDLTLGYAITLAKWMNEDICNYIK